MAEKLTMFRSKDGVIFDVEEEAEAHEAHLDRKERFINWYNQGDNSLWAERKVYAEDMIQWLEEHEETIKVLLFNK